MKFNNKNKNKTTYIELYFCKYSYDFTFCDSHYKYNSFNRLRMTFIDTRKAIPMVHITETRAKRVLS